jgi:N-acetylmuramoyl-L-alanine amidase
MPAIFIFLLKTIIASSVLLGYYLLVLKNKKMAGFNRFYLLGSAAITLLLPFVTFNFSPGQSAASSFPILPLAESRHYEKAFIDTGGPSLPGSRWAVVIYLVVVGLLLLHLVAGILRLYMLKRNSETRHLDGYCLVKTTHPAAPFSFLNLLFWRKDMDISSEAERIMLLHELVHIRQYHTLDKLLLHVLCSLCWLNPFFWIMKHELSLQHEFLADEEAVADGNVEAFAQTLLYTYSGTAFGSATSLFFHSPIKRRLMMLTKKHATTYPQLRRLLIAPLLVLMALIFSFKLNGKENTNNNRSEKKITVVLDAGHGGKDAGAKNAEGVEEKDFTLKVTNKLSELAPEYNVVIVPTRVDDAYPTLQERVDKGNRTEADIFISVHLNKSTADAADANEYELGVCKRTDKFEQSMVLASAVASRMKALGVNTVVVDKSQVYVLNQSVHPSLLIACGNLDDENNLHFLADNEKLESLCRTILSGIVDYSKRK